MLVDHNFMLVLLLLSAVDRGTDHGELLNSEYVPCCVVCGPGLVGRESRSGGPGIGLNRKYQCLSFSECKMQFQIFWSKHNY